MQITIFALLFSMNFARNLYPKLGLENEINPVTEEDSEFARYGHSPAGSMNFDTITPRLVSLQNQLDAETDFDTFDLNHSEFDYTSDGVVNTKITKIMLLGEIHTNIREIEWLKNNQTNERIQMNKKFESLEKAFNCLLIKMGKRDKEFFVVSLMQALCVFVILIFQILTILT